MRPTLHRTLPLWLTLFLVGCTPVTLTLSQVEPSSSPLPSDTHIPPAAPSGGWQQASATGTLESPISPTLTATQVQPATAASAASPTQTQSAATAQAAAANMRIPDEETYNYPQLLGYDSIFPVYEPVFVSAAESPLPDEELVMGVAINGEAKAYPVTALHFREMVDDELGGTPILVTW